MHNSEIFHLNYDRDITLPRQVNMNMKIQVLIDQDVFIIMPYVNQKT